MDNETTNIEKTKFIELINRHLKLTDDETSLTMDADLDSLGLDSLAAVSLMLDLEDTYGVVFQEWMFTEETFATPQTLWEVLGRLHMAKEGKPA